MVEVPIETSLALTLQELEKRLLYFVHHIESDEDEQVELAPRLLQELLSAFVGRELADYLSVESTLIGEPLFLQALIVGRVDVVYMAPQLQEALFQLGVLIVGEVAEELLE